MPDSAQNKGIIEITLELQPVDGPPSGRARAGEQAQEFSGWLGLMSAIDTLVVEAGGTAERADGVGPS